MTTDMSGHDKNESINIALHDTYNYLLRSAGIFVSLWARNERIVPTNPEDKKNLNPGVYRLRSTGSYFPRTFPLREE
jgi:hypothetical protein